MLVFWKDKPESHLWIGAQLVFDGLLIVELLQLRVFPEVCLALSHFFSLRFQLFLRLLLLVKNADGIVKSLLHHPSFISPVPKGMLQVANVLLLLLEIERPLVEIMFYLLVKVNELGFFLLEISCKLVFEDDQSFAALSNVSESPIDC